MSITPVNASSAPFTNASSGSCPVPSGVQVGDIILGFCIGARTASNGYALPAGWTAVTSPSGCVAGYRVVQSGDATSYTWTTTSAAASVVVNIAYRGVDPANPINTSYQNTDASARTFHQIGVVPSVDGARIVGMMGEAHSGDLTPATWSPYDASDTVQVQQGADYQPFVKYAASAAILDQPSTGQTLQQISANTSSLQTGLMCIVALAPPATGTLTGTITDSSTGLPVSGATVSLNDPGSHGTTTDASGNYTLSGVTAGTYTATISKTGYVTATESVTITAGGTATGNYTLTPSVVEVDGSATLKQASTLSATATRVRTAAATLTQASTLSATATVIRATSAALKQASSLAVTANPIRTGSLTAAQASELTATATGVRLAAANLEQAAALTATAEKIPGGGQAFLKQASSLTAAAQVVASGSTHEDNSLAAPDDLTNAVWVASGLTATANSVTAPNGQPTAGTLVESATSGLHFTGQTVTTPAGSLVSLGITAKASGRTRFQLSAIDGGGHNIGVAIFDLSTGAVVSLTAGAISARMDDLGSGWYRCSLLTMTTDTTTGLRLFLLNPSANYSGDGVSGIDVWQAGLSLVAPLAQASELTATATRVQSSGATLAQASALTASGVRVRLSVASLEQATTLAATATRVVLTSADLKQAASLSVTASATLSGVAALAQASSFAGAANALRTGTAALKQASTLTAAAIVVVPPPGSGDGRTLAVFTDSGQARATITDQGRTEAASSGSTSATFGGDGRTTATGGGRTKASWTQ